MTIQERLARAKAGDVVKPTSYVPSSSAPKNNLSVTERLNIAKQVPVPSAPKQEKQSSPFEKLFVDPFKKAYNYESDYSLKNEWGDVSAKDLGSSLFKGGGNQALSGLLGFAGRADELLTNVARTTNKTVKGVYNIEDNTDYSKPYSSGLTELSKIHESEATKAQTESSEGAGRLGQKAVNLSQSAGNMLFNAGLGGATGMPQLNKYILGSSAAGSATNKAIEDGAPLQSALAYGTLVGATEVVSESLFGGNPLFDNNAGLVNRLLSKIPGSSKLVKFLASKPVEMMNEGLEEAISEIMEPIYQMLTYNPNADFATLSEILESAIDGIILSGIMQGGRAVVQAPSKAIQNRLQQAKQTAPTTNIAQPQVEQPSSIPTTPPQSVQNERIAQTDNLAPQEQLGQQRATESVTEPSIASISEMSKEDFKSNPPNGYKYKPSTSTTTQEASADTTNGVIYLTDKFFDLTSNARQFVLSHEKNHFKAEAITSNPQNTELMQAIWGFNKSNPETKYFVEKNVDEVVTELLTDYQENPEWLKEKHPQFYAIAENINNGNLDVAQYGDLSKYIPTYKQYPNTPDGNSLQMFDDVIATNPELAKQKGWDVKAEELRQKVFGEQPQNVQNVQTAADMGAEVTAQAQPPSGEHIDDRTYEEVGNRNVKSFQFENPELHPYFVDAARTMLTDLQLSVKGERTPHMDSDGYITGFKGTKRHTTAPIARLLDNTNLTYDKIAKALEDIIANHGQENHAAAKRVELVLDDILTQGYTTIEGYEMPPSARYAQLKGEIGVNQYGKETPEIEAESPNSLDDLPLPEGLGAMSKSYEYVPRKTEVLTNTLSNTDMLTDKQKDIVNSAFTEQDFTFESVSEKESVGQARERLNLDFSGEVQDLGNPTRSFKDAADVDTSMAILETYAKQGAETGDYTDFANWAKNVYEKSHESATSLQALSKYSRTPEGKVLEAQQEISKRERKLTTTEVNGKQVKNKRGRDIDKGIKDVTAAIEQEAQAAAEAATQDAIKQLTKKKGNVPVELWGVATGDALADRLVSNATKETGTAQPIMQTIFNDLVKFADEHALPKAKRTTTKRTALDRIRDYYANKSIYTEAWKRAQQQVRETLSDNPEALDAFDEWVNSTIDYNADPMHVDGNMLRAILQASDDIGVSKKAIQEISALGATNTITDRIADAFVEQLGVSDADAIQARDAVKRHIAEMALDDNAAKRTKTLVKATAKELGIDVSRLLTQNRANKETAANAIVNRLIESYGISEADAQSVAKNVTDTFFDELRRRSETKLNSMLNPRTRAARKNLITRISELYNMGAFDNNSIAELVKEKYGVPTLTAEDVRNIYEYAKLEAETTDDYQKRVYKYKQSEIIASRMTSTFGEKVLMTRRLAMLLNPKTVISRNAGGNVVFGTAEIIKDAPGTAIDYLTSLKTGKRSTSLNLYETAKAQGKGAKKAVTEIAKDVKLGVDTSPTRHELPTAKTLESKLGRGAEDLLNVLMQFGDRPFFEGTYEARTKELQRLGYDVNSEDVKAHAANYALERVFQNDSELSKKASRIRKSFGLFGEITMPFVQTPTNIFDKLLDYSPYGFARSIKLAGTVSDSVWSQKRFVDTLARAFTGTGVLLFGYFGFLKGFLTGSKRDENEKVIGAEQRAGSQEYSVVVDGKSYTYDWAAPVGALLAMGANMAQAGVNKDSVVSMLAATTKAGIDVMFGQSHLQGLSELFGKENFSEGLQGIMMGLPASFIPTGFQQIARLIDDTQRDTFDKNPVMRMLKRMAVKTPFASKMLPPKIDPTGEEAKQFQGRSTASNAFESFISPGYIGENVQNAVDEELYDLYSRTGDTDVLPRWSAYTSKADLKFSVGGQAYEMTDKEWTQYQKTLGKTTYSEVDKLMKGSEYRKAPDGDKSDLIKDIISTATDKAKREIVEARGDMFLNKAGRERVQEYNKAGLNDKQAYELYNKIQVLEPKDGKKTVSQEQKLDVILSSNHSAKTKAGVVATLYDNSLLHKLDSHSTLLNIYKSTKDTSYINMTVPDKFSENKTEYVLTDGEKALYEKTFVEFMNKQGKAAPIGGLLSEQNRLKTLIGFAKDRARMEVIKSRRK